MKILLVDTDSKIPNLALMKLSTFHTQEENDVEVRKLRYSGYPHKREPTVIDASEYDAVAVSTVFTVNRDKVIVKNSDQVTFGGTGYDNLSALPSWVDDLDEDYSIYPEHNASYGFITRGCIRDCWFCLVPEKEGELFYYRDWQRIVKHKETYFLDNNFLAYNGHKRILAELVGNGVKCQFNQGLDIRLIDGENANLLSQLRYIGEYIFAFDNSRHENIVSRGVQIFKNFVPKDWKMKMFIYTHPKLGVKDVLYRVEWCRNNKILPYLMRDQSCWSDVNHPFYVDLAAYCNQPNLFKKMSFEDYIFKRHPKNISRAEKSFFIYSENVGI